MDWLLQTGYAGRGAASACGGVACRACAMPCGAPHVLLVIPARNARRNAFAPAENPRITKKQALPMAGGLACLQNANAKAFTHDR